MIAYSFVELSANKIDGDIHWNTLYLKLLNDVRVRADGHVCVCEMIWKNPVEIIHSNS